MLAGLRLKVQQHPELRAALALTRPAVLAEASPDDVVWGIGCGPTEDTSRWRGENLLGKLWMKVREEV